MDEILTNSTANNTGTGNLVVRVTEVNNSVPIPMALVLVTREYQGSQILYGALTTDLNGRTPSLPLPAPPAELSEAPSSKIPYETYYVQIYSPGYFIEDNHMVQIFGGSDSYLQINLIPLPEYPDKDVIMY